MRRLSIGFLAAALLPAGASGQQTVDGAINPPLSPRNASYTIDARLDARSRTLTGSEAIEWRNVTTKPVRDLQFHLYWNAWKNARSTFMRERALGGAGRPRLVDDWTDVDIRSIVLTRPSAADLTASTRFIPPDDGNADDETVVAVPLPAAVEPGGTVTVQVQWTAHVPRTFTRTGVVGNFFFIAQWFPKLGVLQDDGWNCHQFHAATEFFSDFGVYDVSLTVPAGWPVGATGVQRDRRDNGDGTTTYRYYQEDVHDFAWTTSPDYIERTARFEHPTLPPVEMRLLLQPEHAGQAERHFQSARATLKSYGEWFGAYPYGHLTIVDPAFQSGADGMEYPTLITAGSRWLMPPLAAGPEGATMHEVGHQFWYGIVANNETEDGWMDEGINTYATARAMAVAGTPAFYQQRYFGGFIPYVFKDIRLPRETVGNRLPGYRAAAKTDPASTPTFRAFPTTAGFIEYNKTALWLNTMERWLGWPTMQRVMSTYFAREKFAHPKPHDFFDAASDVTRRDLTWYFDEVYRSSDVFDYAVQDLRSDREGGGFRTVLVVRRHGEAVFPVDVVVTFQDGERITEHWDGRDRWNLYTYQTPSRAVSAAVDPDRVLLLDINYTNNSKTLEPQGPAAATKWSMTWMVWLQDHLLSWAFFA